MRSFNKTPKSVPPVPQVQPNQIRLSPEETAFVKPFFEACDSRVQGYTAAMEQAKQLVLQQILASRKPT